MASSPAPDLRHVWRWTLLAWLACSITMLCLYRQGYATLDFRDPDDAMRMVQIRDWIGGQSFWDVSQHRVNPPVGGPMHWSRIVDMPVAALILLLRPLLGPAMADIVACITVPLLLLGGLTTALLVATRRLAGKGVALASVVLLLTTPGILIQFIPLRIDHHGWQIMLAGVALAGAMDPRAARGGMVAALALAVWLQISSEALPYVAIFAAAFALRHWIDRAETPRFIAFATTLGGAAAILLFLLKGAQPFSARQCDALTAVYLWPLVALAIMTAIAARLIGPSSAARRFAMAAIGGGAAIVTFLAIGGPCLSGDPFATLGPLAYRLWYLQVMEGRPIWEQPLAMRGVILLPALFGIAATLLAARTASGPARMRWLTLALLLAGATAVSLLVMRALSVAHLFALPGSAWLLLALLRRIQSSPRALVRVTGSVALVLLTPVGLSSAWITLASPSETEAEAQPDCRSTSALAPLRALPPATLFAPIDLGPDILLRTPDDVIATAHHRNAAGIAMVIHGFVDDPQAARSAIWQGRATLLVHCNGLAETRLYAKTNPHGLAAMLARGQAPAWLTPLPGKGPLRLYRINRAGN